MNVIDTISVTEDVTLVTLNNTPADIAFISSVFAQIAAKGINVDMISQAAPASAKTSLSFTIADEDLGGILGLVAVLRAEDPSIRPVVSSSNVKISVSGEAMRTLPGVASRVFAAAAAARSDIRLVTTSEIDISLLVTKADFPALHEAIVAAFPV